MAGGAGKVRTVGLRVDVDTFRGTRDGVPRLLKILAAHDIRASFFFSVGPDNMGRHLWRLLKPAFLLKMFRSNAASLYGWDILLRGTFWPGPDIGRHLAQVIRDTDTAGHEIGLHAWDHHRWQAKVESMSRAEIRLEIDRGMARLHEILGREVDCSAAAGWKCTGEVLLEKETRGFRYNSDCRGESLFRPVVDGGECAPQVPITLPTYDEIIGRDGVTDDNYNRRLLAMLRPGALNVLTIHAEVEGIARAELFERFLGQAAERDVRFAPLSVLLPPPQEIPLGAIGQRPLPGREGDLCRQVAGAD
ncbi:MAG: 4-deoxy-4-formamido-L-arabinose-phosphoundecaprenol deformylase [Pseudomonadota bacterium]|nr:4-deoxy-4-formamido-L-arabinose-phosphoundecaprenol deformylase [Pseudomonadota bacterium]